MNFIDVCAGIGGFRLGMEMAGHKCVGFVEWNKYARQSYQAVHNTKGEWTAHDITRVSNDDIRELRDRSGRIDVICGGFPCQAFSVAGKRGGFEDTRGTIIFEIMRFASILRPRYLFLENVVGLLSHDDGNTFETILRTLDEIGYVAEWDCINSKDYGVPQDRERVFIVGHLRGRRTRKIFPLSGERGATSKKLQELTKGLSQAERVYDSNGLARTLNAEAGGGGAKTGLYLVYQKGRGKNAGGFHEIAPTVTSNSYEQNHFIYDGSRIRKLTPRECWRLQGFPDWAFDRAQAAGVSETQLIKQAGNSAPVPVCYEIARRLEE